MSQLSVQENRGAEEGHEDLANSLRQLSFHEIRTDAGNLNDFHGYSFPQASAWLNDTAGLASLLPETPKLVTLRPEEFQLKHIYTRRSKPLDRWEISRVA